MSAYAGLAYTGPDALGVYLTTAHRAGDCLGGTLCELEFQGLAPMVTSPGLGRCRIEAISQIATLASGTITRTGGHVTFQTVDVYGNAQTSAAYDYPGDDVPLLLAVNTFWVRVLFDGSYTPTINRADTSSEFPAGTPTEDGALTFTLSRSWNNALGHGDSDATDRAGNLTQYRCVYLAARVAVTLTGFSGTAFGSDATMTFALEAVGALHNQYLALDSNGQPVGAPTGLTFSANPASTPVAMAAGTVRALWIKSVQGSGVGVGLKQNSCLAAFDIGADSYYTVLYGSFRAADDSLTGYRVYGSTTGAVGGDLLDTFTALPHDMYFAPPVSGSVTWNLRIAAVNRYGIESLERLLTHRVTVDHLGADLTVPDAPTGVAVTDAGGGMVSVSARYTPTLGHPFAQAWRIAIINDMDGDTSELFTLGNRDQSGRYQLDETLGPFSWGATLAVTVSTMIDGRAASADPVPWLVDAAAPCGTGDVWAATGQQIGADTPLDLMTLAASPFTLQSYPGRAELWFNGEMIIYAHASTYGVYIGTDYDLIDDDLTGPCTDTGTVAYVRAGSVPVMKIDTTARTLTAAGFLLVTHECPVSAPAWETPDALHLIVWDAMTRRYRTWAQFNIDATVQFNYDVQQEAI